MQLGLLTVVAAATTYSRFILSPLQEAVRLSMRLSDNQIAVLQGPAMALPLALGVLPLGIAVDRYSRQCLLVLFVGLCIAGNLITALTSSFALLCLARGLIGLAVPATAITVLSMLADLYPPEARGRALMVTAIGQVAGMSIAFALGGNLLGRWDSEPTPWRWTLLALTAPLVLVMVLMWVVREPARTGVGVASPRTRGVIRELWAHRAPVLSLLAGGSLVAMVDTAVEIWATPTFSRTFELPPDRIGALMATSFLVSGIVGPVAGGTLSDRCLRTGGPKRAITALSILALLSVPASLFSVVTGVTMASLLLAAFVTMGSAISVMTAALYTVVVPNELRGLCMGISSVVAVPLSLGLAPLAVSGLSGAIGGPGQIGVALTIVCMLISVLGAVAFRVGKQYLSSAAL